jgi:hypothetical protein
VWARPAKAKGEVVPESPVQVEARQDVGQDEPAQRTDVGTRQERERISPNFRT